MFELIVGFLIGVYFWRCWTWPRTRKVNPGLNRNIILPHSTELELHYSTLSSCSQKVRACLGETGLKFKAIHHVLPPNGWETKCPDYLNNVNPAGTVPVLIHNGHPIYESHEQILYIDQVLMTEGSKLTPDDPAKKAIMEKWLRSASMIPSAGGNHVLGESEKMKIGDIQGAISLPIFAAKIIHDLTIWNFLETASMIPLVANRSFISMIFMFKFYGVDTFFKIQKVKNVVSQGRKGIDHHFELLANDIEKSGGPYICGSQYTLADISLIPILERMEYAKWWTESVKEKHPTVFKYWENIKKRDGYLSSRSDQEMHKSLVRLGVIIDEWKIQFQWFNDFYEN